MSFAIGGKSFGWALPKRGVLFGAGILGLRGQDLGSSVEDLANLNLLGIEDLGLKVEDLGYVPLK